MKGGNENATNIYCYEVAVVVHFPTYFSYLCTAVYVACKFALNVCLYICTFKHTYFFVDFKHLFNVHVAMSVSIFFCNQQ